MGLFDFLKKKKTQSDDQQDPNTDSETKPNPYIVTEAVDPSQISEAKKLEDLKKLDSLNNQLSQSSQGNPVAVITEDTPEMEGLRLKNPFRGV